jgi:hypothetical protein
MTEATAARTHDVADPTATSRLRSALLAVGVAAFLASLAFSPAEALRTSRTAADEPQYLLTAISLVEDHSLDLADELSAARWRDFAGRDLPRQTQPTPDGREISPHDPGLPVLLAVPVEIAGWVGAKVLLAAVNGALAAVLLWTAVRRFGVSRRIAVPVVLALTLAPPLAVYGAQVYPELPGALCVAGIIALTGAECRRSLALAGVVVLATAAAWLSIKFVPVAGLAAVVALSGWWRRGDRRAVGVAVGAAGVLGVLWAFAHVAWYGGLTPYASGDFFAENGGQLSVMGDQPDRVARTVRLLGLLVDRDFGLGAWQPLWLLLVPAIAVLLVRRPPRWASIAAPLAAGWAMGTWVAVTMHGWWFPGRHIVHALPCAALAIAWWLHRLAIGRVVAWVGVVIGAVSSLWLAAQTAFDDVTLVFDPWATTDPVLRLMQPLLPNMRDHGIEVGGRYVAWLVLLVGGAALAVRHELRRRSVLDDVIAEPGA